MFGVDEKDFKIKIHNGWLIVTESADKEDYPGLFVFFSKDGETFSMDNLITVVEQCVEENSIRTDCYKKGQDECAVWFDYETGEMNWE